MKTFKTGEIRVLLDQVYRDEISFSRMVEVINERVSEAEDIPEKLKEGDLAIFWDEVKGHASVRFYDRSNESEEYFKHKDQGGFNWKNAIKFESIEQYERFIKGEI